MSDKTSTTPELLQLFVLTAKHGSIAAAARSMNMSPSLATRKIAQLEMALKSRLFERTTRNTILTEAGTIALAWATRSLEEQEAVMDNLAAIQVSPSGLIRIAVTQYAATVLLPPLLASFAKQYPQIKFSISTTDSLVNLVSEHYDIAIHSGRVPNSGMIGRRVMQFKRVLCAAPAYIAQRGAPTEPNHLAQHDCIAHAINEPRIWFFLRDAELTSQPINPLIEADDYRVLLNLARESMGVVRVAQPLVADDINAGRLVELMPDYKCVYGDGELPGLWVLYPNRHVLYRTRLLIDFLVERLALDNSQS
jgi:LysR family transcriptional activator of dmlA